MDTNQKNTAARALYKKLGYREVDIRLCGFNGIPGVNLVLLEKKADMAEYMDRSVAVRFRQERARYNLSAGGALHAPSAFLTFCA